MSVGSHDGISPPLDKRRILITRARDQARDITSVLEGLGAEVVHVPTIEFVDPESWAPVDSAIENLFRYDWMIFTSANGVRFFFHRLYKLKGETGARLSRTNVLAIGPATARALESAGSPACLVAPDSKGEGVLRALVEWVGGEEGLSGKRLLIPRAEVARELLPDELRRLGALVDVIAVYRTVKPEVDGTEIVRMFREREVDAVVFTSSSTVSNLSAIVSPDDLSALLSNVVIACIGPITAATATDHGLKNIVQPDTYTSEALVGALVKVLA